MTDEMKVAFMKLLKEELKALEESEAGEEMYLPSFTKLENRIFHTGWHHCVCRLMMFVMEGDQNETV